MTKIEYQGGIQAAAVAACMLAETDLPEILRKIEHADAFGGVLDPTLYREKHQAMMEDKALVEAAMPLWRKGQELKALAAEAKKALQPDSPEERKHAGS